VKKTLPLPEVATGSQLADTEITDKKGYAQHWLFSVRKVDNLLAEGLPHCKVGKRRVRIMIAEADRWMVERFGQQRSPVRTATSTHKVEAT